MTPHERFETLTIEAMRACPWIGLKPRVLEAAGGGAGQLTRYDDEDDADWSSYPVLVR